MLFGFYWLILNANHGAHRTPSPACGAGALSIAARPVISVELSLLLPVIGAE
jgi:hypothetical protein